MDQELKVKLKDFFVALLIAMLFGAVLWIYTPTLIYVVGFAVIVYVALTLYYGIKERSR